MTSTFIQRPTVALLTNPEQRATLATARALAGSGCRVLTIGPDRALAGTSRAVVRHVRSAKIDGGLPSLEEIAHAVAAHDVDLVLPITDAACRVLLGREEEVRAVIGGPHRDAYLRASDKARVLSKAASCGIRTPRQVILASPDDPALNGWAAQESVVKPTHSVVELAGKATAVPGARYASGNAELLTLVPSYPAEAFPLLLQERALGAGVGVFLWRVAGETPLVFGHRRLREKPPSGGVSTYREAMVPPASLVAASERLLDALEYEGVAMVEFKHDPRTGEHVLMEINARLWGSLQLAIDAGVNFPLAVVNHALGLPLPKPTVIRHGVRSVWELGELDHAFALATQSREQLHLQDGAPVGLMAALRALSDHRLTDRTEVFRWRDPMPFFAELTRWIQRR